MTAGAHRPAVAADVLKVAASALERVGGVVQRLPFNWILSRQVEADDAASELEPDREHAEPRDRSSVDDLPRVAKDEAVFAGREQLGIDRELAESDLSIEGSEPGAAARTEIDRRTTVDRHLGAVGLDDIVNGEHELRAAGEPGRIDV